jgi:hypothetical protein
MSNTVEFEKHWAWRVALLASLSAWLLHALLDDFERFWPASVAFWLIVGLSLRVADTQHAERGEQTLGRVTLAHEQDDARSERLVPLFGTAAQDQKLTPRLRGTQAL